MGPLWRGVWDSTDVCDVVPNGSAHRFGSRPKGERLSRVLDEELFSLDADASWRKKHSTLQESADTGKTGKHGTSGESILHDSFYWLAGCKAVI